MKTSIIFGFAVSNIAFADDGIVFANGGHGKIRLPDDLSGPAREFLNTDFSGADSPRMGSSPLVRGPDCQPPRGHLRRRRARLIAGGVAAWLAGGVSIWGPVGVVFNASLPGAALAQTVADNATTPTILDTPTIVESAESDNAANPSSTDAKGPLAQIDEPVLPNHIRRALFLDPRVSEANARACQAVHRLGLRRAEARPQLSGSITGGKRVAGRIKKDPGAGGFFGDRRTPEEKELHETGAHRRDYNYQENDNIYDVGLSLRYTFWDWGQSESAISAKQLEHEVAQIDARSILSQRGFELLNLGLRLRLLDRVLDALRGNAEIVAEQIDIVRARVDAGAGRISELREARLIALDLEIELNRLDAQRAILVDQLATDFELNPSDADFLVTTFWFHRQDSLAHLTAERTDKAHAVRLRMQIVAHEEKQIKGSRYPKFEGILDGKIFDFTDHKNEYEIVGKLEMRMPLYDGGAAAARLRETSWRSRELKSSLDALYREHDRELERVNSRFNDLQREDRETRARLNELRERLGSLMALQGQTVTSPLQLARLQVEMGRAQTQLIELEIESEVVRSNALFLAEQLDDVLALRIGESGC